MIIGFGCDPPREGNALFPQVGPHVGGVGTIRASTTSPRGSSHDATALAVFAAVAHRKLRTGRSDWWTT